MTTAEIKAERTAIEEQNKSLRQRLNKKRQQLEDYLKEAERYNQDMRYIQDLISKNNDRYFELGKLIRSS